MPSWIHCHIVRIYVHAIIRHCRHLLSVGLTCRMLRVSLSHSHGNLCQVEKQTKYLQVRWIVLYRIKIHNAVVTYDLNTTDTSVTIYRSDLTRNEIDFYVFSYKNGVRGEISQN